MKHSIKQLCLMTVKYTAIKKANPSKSDEFMFYPTITNSGKIDLKMISARISSMMSLNRSDIIASIDALLQIIILESGQGKIIDLGDLGSFYLRIRGGGKKRKQDVMIDKETSIRIYFKPGKELKAALKKHEFQRIRS